jgi:hypothetical protein
MFTKSFLFLFLMGGSGLLIAPQPAAGEKVDHVTFSIGIEGGTYNGDAFYVLAPNGNITGFGQLSLSSGVPVAEPTKKTVVFFPTPYGFVDCELNLFPPGAGNLHCHS